MSTEQQGAAAAAGQPFLLTEDIGPVRVLTINRADAHNALSSELVAAIGAGLADAAQDVAVGSVVLTGSGRMFSAGGNLDRLLAERGADTRAAEVTQLARCLEIIGALVEFPKPTIAMVNGPVAGGGLALALGCAVRIASERARFVYAYTSIGLAGDLGVNWLLGRLLGRRRALSFALAPSWTAEEALRLGLIDHVASADDLREVTLGRARELAAVPAAAFAQIRRNIEASVLPFAEGAAIEAEAFHAMRDTDEHRAAVAALIERMQNRPRK